MSTPTSKRPGLIYIRKDPSWDEHGWTSVPNAVLRDASLSWEARGAFAWMTSHRSTFALRSEDLAEAGPKGRNHARDMLRELEEHGWLTRHKERNPDTGRHELTIYNLHPIQVPKAERTWVESTAKAPPALKAKLKPQVSPATARTGAGRPVADRSDAEREGISRARCLDPLEDHLLTEEENHTTARERAAADKPPCVDEPIVPVKSKLDDAPQPLKENTEGDIQVELGDELLNGDSSDVLPAKFYAQDDPFSGQDGDPEQAEAVRGWRPRSAGKAVRNQGAGGSPEAFSLLVAYGEQVCPLPAESRNQLLPRVTSLLGQGFERQDIFTGITETLSAKIGWTHLGMKVAGARLARTSMPQSTVGDRLQGSESLRAMARQMDADEAAGQLGHFGMRAIGGGK